MGKGLSLQILLTSFMILLNTIPSEPKSVSELKRYFHSLSNVTVIADHGEFEFLHSSYVERMLANAADSFVTPNTLIASKAAVDKCGRGKPYRSCLPPSNANPPKSETCSTYKRGDGAGDGAVGGVRRWPEAGFVAGGS
ncbi:hypothetical protein E1A91_D07G092900v1 [Gossypium mustelinum]|uniref:Uncharacterized protein n=1 Tax=Gossypium mustelinum TaxID=34275 RepID=A0A5D2U5T5_GOSMU|nr:hypothetical protein E1A91_D07G092900v1 [Gossypium mustelinum]TYI72913.1 hypothetical protein E1A91_D07G092900v1 [Gossypium mustelinum]